MGSAPAAAAQTDDPVRTVSGNLLTGCGVTRVASRFARMAAKLACVAMVMLAPVDLGAQRAGSGAGIGARTVAAADESLVDDVSAARTALESARAAAMASTSGTRAERAMELVRLGLWSQADRLLADTASGGAGVYDRLAASELLVRRHSYVEARELVRQARRDAPGDRGVRLADARMYIESWELHRAAAIADSLLKEQPNDAMAAVIVGRIHLLEKRFDEALAWARRAQQMDPGHAPAHVLEADALFWKLDLNAAEQPLRRALALDPFDADARFHYGYAIWRRVDARQLPDMAAQWNLAMDVNPLHYLTHWHFGNGHTHLTYADYAHPTDSVVRVELLSLDSLVARDSVAAAIARSRELERRFEGSVLPAMLRGSAFYMAYDMDRADRLDSAQAVFEAILARKPNYGPAHNGLAAVIKQRHFSVHAAFDSLEREIANTSTAADPAFDAVFSDLAMYPGDRVRQMARQQLGPSYAYLDMLARQGKVFRIPPLHHDLAQAMDRRFFRGATTFDNRQWMDIRGVGSGAAGIEYVERGSHQERNVLNHEYVHLFHGQAFTDAESRRVRELYYDAMANGRVIDYYAANNESEFLAQSYEAYISPEKVHPLNHKAMNTRADLAAKDPPTYAFVDSLVQRQERYLAGDRSVFASNWAQTYVNVADSVRRQWTSDSARGARAADSARLSALGRSGTGSPLADSVAGMRREYDQRLLEVAALLDSALAFDGRYIPVMLSYSGLRSSEHRFNEAEEWLERARLTDTLYAPTYAAMARLVAARADEEQGGVGQAELQRQAALMERSLSLETDIGVRASLSGQLRSLYLSHAMLVDAVRVADEYVRTAPTVSTYLRDTRDAAEAFAWSLRGEAGYANEALEYFRDQVQQNPQNWGLRSRYAAVAVIAGELDEAIATLEDAQRILRAGGNLNAGIQSSLADLYLQRGDSTAAREAIAPLLRNSPRPASNDRNLVRVIARLGDPDEAERRLREHRGVTNTPSTVADVAYTRGVLAEARGDLHEAQRLYLEAVAANPYHGDARQALGWRRWGGGE